MGVDGIAISSDGSSLYYCPLGSRKLYSGDTDSLVDRSFDERKIADTMVDKGDRGGASDGLESDATGYIYSTNYEHNSIMPRHPNDRG
jgi:sugar lactone lactonase YvrE